MKEVAKAAYIITLMILAICFQAFVLVKLWAWFIIPIFQYPALTIKQAIGLGFFISLIRTSEYKKDEKNESHIKNFTLQFGYSVFRSLFILASGWILIQLM